MTTCGRIRNISDLGLSLKRLDHHHIDSFDTCSSSYNQFTGANCASIQVLSVLPPVVEIGNWLGVAV